MPLLSYFYLLSQVCVVFVGGFYYRNLPIPLKILEWLVTFVAVETAVEWMLAAFSIQNLWISHINTLVEFALIALIYSYWLKAYRNRLALKICLAMFIVYWIVSKFTFEPFSLLDGWTSALAKLLQIVFSALLLVEIVKESDIEWINNPRIWVVSGVIIYAAGSLFMFALFNKMLQISPELFLMVWPFNWVLMIISNLFFARGFLCKR